VDRAAADRAIVQREFGPPEVLRQEEVPPPEPGEGRVRIAVEAAGVHVIDTSIRAGSAILPFPLPELPMTPGREVAGAVDAVGPGVDASWRCRRVVPHLVMASGGYAERAVASAAALHEVPERLEAATAVAAIGTGRPAVGILDEARIAPADVVLATAAAGGLGSLFVQAACSAGATAVEAAGGAAKAERVRALGADVVVDDLAPGWGERVIDALGGRRPAVVLNCVGGALGREAADLLAPGGRLILLGYSSGEPDPLATRDIVRLGISVTWALGAGISGRMRELETRALAEAAAGRLVPVVGRRFPLADAAAAHRAIEARHTIGKTVLVP
jgi:NADPH2:quinone reductase